MSITRQPQDAANDLAMVEQALFCLHELLPVRNNPAPIVPAVPFVIKHVTRSPWKKGNCTEFSTVINRQCAGPASNPMGLCYTHFAALFGHRFSFGRCVCGAQKLEWDRARGWSEYKSYQMANKAQCREFCDGNGQSDRAKEIKRSNRVR